MTSKFRRRKSVEKRKNISTSKFWHHFDVEIECGRTLLAVLNPCAIKSTSKIFATRVSPTVEILFHTKYNAEAKVGRFYLKYTYDGVDGH